MKNKILFGTCLLIASIAGAQTQPPVTTDSSQVAQQTSVSTDASINTAYVADAESLKGLKSEALTPQHFFPALGTYKATGTSTEDVTITLDEANKGIVWVEGLSQGKFKALMKKAPSTYKIPSQKLENGKNVSEGTLFLNPTTKELTIVLGRAFDDADPTSFLTIPTKTKSKAWQYTGVKADATAAVTPASQQ